MSGKLVVADTRRYPSTLDDVFQLMQIDYLVDDRAIVWVKCKSLENVLLHETGYYKHVATTTTTTNRRLVDTLPNTTTSSSLTTSFRNNETKRSREAKDSNGRINKVGKAITSTFQRMMASSSSSSSGGASSNDSNKNNTNRRRENSTDVPDQTTVYLYWEERRSRAVMSYENAKSKLLRNIARTDVRLREWFVPSSASVDLFVSEFAVTVFLKELFRAALDSVAAVVSSPQTTTFTTFLADTSSRRRLNLLLEWMQVDCLPMARKFYRYEVERNMSNYLRDKCSETTRLLLNSNKSLLKLSMSNNDRQP